MLVIGTMVLGVDDIPGALAFWSEALGYHPRRPPDDSWVILDPPTGVEGASMALMQTRAKVHLPPRIHIDLYADDQAAEVDRLIGLGARCIEWDRYPENADFVILEDPQGNRFCVVEAPGWFKPKGHPPSSPESGG